MLIGSVAGLTSLSISYKSALAAIAFAAAALCFYLFLQAPGPDYTAPYATAWSSDLIRLGLSWSSFWLIVLGGALATTNQRRRSIFGFLAGVLVIAVCHFWAVAHDHTIGYASGTMILAPLFGLAASDTLLLIADKIAKARSK